MLWRILVTISAWLVSILGFRCLCGPRVIEDIVLLIGVFAGCVIWIPLLVRERGTAAWYTALVIVLLSVLAMSLIAIQLPRTYEAQKRFNEHIRDNSPSTIENDR